MPEPRLPLELAEERLDCADLESKSAEDLIGYFLSDPELRPRLPEREGAWNPLFRMPVVYSSVRKKRPHLYESRASECPICGGDITRIVDLHRLNGDEFCFINKNLYPLVFPWSFDDPADRPASEPLENETWRSLDSEGLHFLLWTSNRHERNTANMGVEEGTAVLSRIAALERKLLHSGVYPGNAEHSGRFLIIKNKGARSGGSVAHDHFQMIFTPILPARLEADLRLFSRVGPSEFRRNLAGGDPSERLVASIGDWDILATSHAVRPFQLAFVCRSDDASVFHHLPIETLRDLARILKGVSELAPRLFDYYGSPEAYNFIFHNSGVGPVYVEFLPNLQPSGGFEKLGLSACSSTPDSAFAWYGKQLLFE